MRWYLRADMTGAPTQDQIDQVADDGLVFAHFNSERRTAQVQVAVEAADHTSAIRKGLAIFGRLANVQQLVADGLLSPPFRITVESEEGAQRALGVLATKEVAALLGMSDARVRQLKDTDPLFPRPVQVPGAAGDFYREIDVAGYRRARRAGSSDAGRPRVSDEPRLRAALQAVLDHSTILNVAKAQIRSALLDEGGRYVRGKALLLTRQPPGHLAEVENALPGDAREEFRATLQRAREIIGG
jgi:predicted DNA-binding transcriptional regulator AlpA